MSEDVDTTGSTDESVEKAAPPIKQGDRLFKGLLLGSGSILLLLMVFWLGMMVGEHKAQFTLKWGEKYEDHFGGMKEGKGSGRGLLPKPSEKPGIGGHGVAGEILEVGEDSMIVLGANNLEQVVLIDNDTRVIIGRSFVGLDKVQVGTHAVVIGSPTKDAEIDARMIKIFDKAPRGLMHNSGPSGHGPMGRL